ncbi:MAG: alpha/beta fold hydrolase [Burkholderiales bacterium]|nr:alpha/beta fold hydrolase [Burkholderiales bacterium]
MNSAIQTAPTPEQLARAFLTPSRQSSAAEPEFLSGATHFSIDTPEGKVAARHAGAGPAVLLVHGWEGRASDLAAFAPPLLDAGYRVVAIDLPAHGRSEAKRTSIPQSADALLRVQQALGPLHAAIAHSVGTAVVVEAMAAGMQVGRVALISAPARYVDYVYAYAAQAGLEHAQAEQMIAALKDMRVDVRAVQTPSRARQMRQPALFVHSADDRVVSINDGRENSGAWPGARFMQVENLGHRRVLQAPEVVHAVTAFVRTDEPQPFSGQVCTQAHSNVFGQGVSQ